MDLAQDRGIASVEDGVGAMRDRVVEGQRLAQVLFRARVIALVEGGGADHVVRVDAQRRIYRLNPEGLREVDEWLAPYRAFWEERLDAMEQTLDSMEA